MRHFALGVLLTAALLSSCNQPHAKDDLKGKWSFHTKAGDYSELWISDTSLATIKSPRERVYVFSYHLQKDSVMIYEHSSDTTVLDAFLVSQWHDDNLVIVQDGVENKLVKISGTAPLINNTLQFRKNMETEFRTRLKANLTQ